MPEYIIEQLLVAKQIAEVMMDRTIDSNVLKQINKEIYKLIQSTNNK
jgi:hypothetical protein